MNTKASVLHTDGNTATVRAFKQSACAGCSGCNGKEKCHVEFMLAEIPDSYDLKVRNDIGAKSGDVVEICTDSGISLFLAFITFITPVIGAVIAYLIAETVKTGVLPVLTSGCAFIVLFFVCAVVANKLSGRYAQTYISKIIKESGEE